MKTNLRIFAGNNFLIGIGILALLLSNPNSIKLFSLVLVFGHFGGAYGLLVRKDFGWYLNIALSTNLVIISIFAVISTQLLSANGYGYGGTSPTGKLYGFTLTIVVLIAAFSLFRTNKSDIIHEFKITNTLRIAAFFTGILSATYLIVTNS